MSDEDTLPEKREVARMLLVKGSVFVHIDPRIQGVIVPDWLRKQPQLVLQVGLDLPVPIPDLAIDEDGVYATLSFNRSAFSCRMPWEAVFALVGDDGKGMVWPESFPVEIAHEVDRESGRKPPLGLRLVEDSDDMGDQTDPGESRARPRRAPKLERVREPVIQSLDSIPSSPERSIPSLSVVPEPAPEPATVTQLPGTEPASLQDGDDPEPPRPSSPPNLRLIK